MFQLARHNKELQAMLKPGGTYGEGDEALEFYAKHTAQIEVSDFLDDCSNCCCLFYYLLEIVSAVYLLSDPSFKMPRVSLTPINTRSVAVNGVFVNTCQIQLASTGQV